MRKLSVVSCQLSVVSGQLRVASLPLRADNGRRTNRAITLLEVLISIGVLAVGVMGAASLLPMATYYQNETTKYDRGGALAQQAAHDLQIKNYLSPRRWLFLDPASPSVSNPIGILGLTQSTAPYNPQSAIVIDPLGFSYVAAQTPPVVGFPCYFPAFPNQGASPPGTTASGPKPPTIYRAGVTANDYWPPAATMPLANPILMPFSVADRLFRSSDDVLFDTPSDADARPQSLSGSFTPSFAGDFSWIATVARTPSDSTNAAQMHRFQVSVVVLQKRDVTLWATGLTPEQPPPERQVYAAFLQYGGQTVAASAPFYGGGGLQLYVYENSAAPPPGQPSRHWLDNIKSNTYLMLSANFTDSLGAGGGNPYPRLTWYRIITVDDGPLQDPNNSARWYRNINVTGGDWPTMIYTDPQTLTASPFPLWIGADPLAPGGAASPITFCTLMDDAVAEYDATITLDYSLVRQ
jgi:type II secretory pathway pseudopilin PulG